MVSIDTLQRVREQLQLEIAGIDKALSVLTSEQEGLIVHPNGSNGKQRRKRVWTKAQREHMATMQRKRWKELRAKEKAGA